MAHRQNQFVVYGITSTVCDSEYASLRHALARAAKLNAAEAEYGEHGIRFGVCSIQEYRDNVVHMVERTNLRTGTKYVEPSNTPGYCSPSSEAYWSM